MKLHILGICGTFMGGVAVLARGLGHRVTGCDANVYPPMSTQLAAQGITLIEGWDADQLALEPDVFVIGNVVTRGNALMEAILARGLPYVSGPQWLAENVLAGRHVLAVAGTHGKTTTSAMLAWILENAGLAPGFLIGGVPENFGVSARITGSCDYRATHASHPLPPGEGRGEGQTNIASSDHGATHTSHPLPSGEGRGEGAIQTQTETQTETQTSRPLFVIEADEYDTAFFDKRSKFVHYRPRTAILNNLEYDHADIFPDLAAIETQFHHLVRTIPANGLIVANGRDAALARVLGRGAWTPVETFDTPRGWSARETDATSFDVLLDGESQASVHWPLLGAHNRANALAAIAAARHVGVPPAQSAQSLGRFTSVQRRLQLRGSVNGVHVYDDFAHHPTAIRATLEALRSHTGSARILAVIEPRSNTMKLGLMKAALPDSLAAAEQVFCYSGGLDWDAAAALAPLGHRAEIHADLNALVEAIARAARPGDHVLVMSNGGFGGIHDKLLARLAA